MEKQIDQFTVKTDDGKKYEIIAYQEFISVATHDDPNGMIAGMKRLATSTGLAVNLNNDYTFEIVETHECARRV